jgi:hypothetical protein
MATAAEIEATLEQLKAQRITLATTGSVKEVWRDGRRIVYDKISMKDLNALIAEYESLLAAAQAEEGTGRKRFRALSVRF